MKIVIDTEENINRLVADSFISLIKKNPKAIIGLATGSTPVGVYKELIKACEKGTISFKDVKSFNLDEYLGLPFNHEQSYRYFMNDNLFKGIDIKKENTHFPSLEGDYDKSIETAGGVDLQILGIGRDCHIAFNEPNTPFDSKTHIAELTKETIEDNSRFFNSIDEVPTKAVTMGLATIMKSREIVLVAFGKNKADAIYHLVKGEPCEEYPASILQKHKNVTIYCDADAASLIK